MRTTRTQSICRIVALSTALSTALFAGCSQVPTRESWPWEKEVEPPRASRILAIWSDTVLNSPGKPPTRGFGGRVFFYGDRESEPIEVDGTVLVYAFDSKKLDRQSAAPEKRFVFPAQNLSRHYSKCTLGHSYNFWLPWDKIGGPTRQISLIVRYEGNDGTVVLSDASRKLLPGIAANVPPDQVKLKSTQETVQRVGYQTPAVPFARTETIRLTPSMSERLRRAGNAQPVQQDAAQKKHFQAVRRMDETSATGHSLNDRPPDDSLSDNRLPEFRPNQDRRTDGRFADDGQPAPIGPTGQSAAVSVNGAQSPYPVSPQTATTALSKAGDPFPLRSDQSSLSAPEVSPQGPSTGYRPTISRAPFPSTSQRFVAGSANRPSLGPPRFDRPPVRKAGFSAGR